MKILIGTPIHVSKDYCMERWLLNVAKLRRTYPADLLLVDNSPGLAYVEKVKGYLAKYSIKNYKIEHIEMNQELIKYERIAVSQDMIRKEILARDFDALFSWESDILLPPDALHRLVRIMKSGNFTLVIHNSWSSVRPALPDFEMGCTLIGRKAMEKHTFITPPPPGTDDWEGEEDCFKNRVVSGGGSYCEVAGVIAPIYHLNK